MRRKIAKFIARFPKERSREALAETQRYNRREDPVSVAIRRVWTPTRLFERSCAGGAARVISEVDFSDGWLRIWAEDGTCWRWQPPVGLDKPFELIETLDRAIASACEAD